MSQEPSHTGTTDVTVRDDAGAVLLFSWPDFVTSICAIVGGCVEIKIYGAFVLNLASSSTPSKRRLLDGVAMPVSRRSTEPARPRHRREMT